MYKRTIKVIKKDLAGSVKVIIAVPKVAKKIHLDTVKTINNWIDEQRENSRLEKIFSDTKILSWN